MTEELKSKIRAVMEGMNEYMKKHPGAIERGMELMFEDTTKAIREHFDRLPPDSKARLLKRLTEVKDEFNDKEQA